MILLWYRNISQRRKLLYSKLIFKEKNKNNYQIGKYGHLRLLYLKDHKKVEYSIVLLVDVLRKHIVNTDMQAKERLELFINKMLDKNLLIKIQKILTTLKLTELMNNYKCFAK